MYTEHEQQRARHRHQLKHFALVKRIQRVKKHSTPT